MRINNEDLLDIDGSRATVDLSSSANLKPIWVAQEVLCSVQLTMTGTPAGNWRLQASNDAGNANAASEAQKYAGVSTWTDITSPVTVSAAGTLLMSVVDCPYMWVRAVWTATGAGTTPVLTAARGTVKGV